MAPASMRVVLQHQMISNETSGICSALPSNQAAEHRLLTM